MTTLEMNKKSIPSNRADQQAKSTCGFFLKKKDPCRFQVLGSKPGGWCAHVVEEYLRQRIPLPHNVK